MNKQVSLPGYLNKAIGDVLTCLYSDLWIEHFTSYGESNNWMNHCSRGQMKIFEQHYREFMAVMDKVYRKEDCTGESIWTIIEATRAKGWLQEFLEKAEVRKYTHDDLEMADFKEKKGLYWVPVDDSAQLQMRLIELLDDTLTKVEELHRKLRIQWIYWEESSRW